MRVKAPIGAVTAFLPNTLPDSSPKSLSQAAGASSRTRMHLQRVCRIRHRIVVWIVTARKLGGVGSTIGLGQFAEPVRQSFVQLMRSVAPGPVAAGAAWSVHARVIVETHHILQRSNGAIGNGRQRSADEIPGDIAAITPQVPLDARAHRIP